MGMAFQKADDPSDPWILGVPCKRREGKESRRCPSSEASS
jgi:hypothetical protein